MEYNQGVLIKTSTGWDIKDGEKSIPLDTDHYNTSNLSRSFIWNDCRYNEGETIKYRIHNKYVEPPADIHPNRGGITQVAQIIEDWDHIFQRLPLGKEVPDKDYVLLVKFLKENYGEPQRLK